jgi:hypothetical protein
MQNAPRIRLTDVGRLAEQPQPDRWCPEYVAGGIAQTKAAA